jgi:folate-binding protein YgfZ
MAIVTRRAAERPRDYVRVAGPDAADFLQRMVSNDVGAAPCDALLLTPKGRIVAPLRVLPQGEDEFLLLTEPGLGDTVRPTLLRARFAARCEVVSEEHASVVVWDDDFAAADELLDGEVEPTASAGELERARIAAGIPAWGKELDASILPAEAGLDRTHVSFSKGCYPGQEPIARLRHRGHVNRTLRRLDVDSASPGDEIRYEGRVVGRVTSAVAGIALGYVRVEVPPDAALEVGGRPARLH